MLSQSQPSSLSLRRHSFAPVVETSGTFAREGEPLPTLKSSSSAAAGSGHQLRPRRSSLGGSDNHHISSSGYLKGFSDPEMLCQLLCCGRCLVSLSLYDLCFKACAGRLSSWQSPAQYPAVLKASSFGFDIAISVGTLMFHTLLRTVLLSYRDTL